MRFETSTLMAVAAILSVASARPHGGAAAGQLDGQGSAAGAGTGAGAGAGAGVGGDSLLSGFMAGLSSLLGGAIPTGGAGFSGFGSGGNGVYLTGGVAVPTGGAGSPGQGNGLGGFLGIGFSTEVQFGNAVPTAGAGQHAFNQPPGRVDSPPPAPTATQGSGAQPTGGAVQPSFGGSPGGALGGEDHPGIATPTSDISRATPAPTLSTGDGGISKPVTTARASLPVNTINFSTFSFVFASTAAPGGRNGGFGANSDFGGSGGFGGSDGSAGGFLNGLFGKKKD